MGKEKQSLKYSFNAQLFQGDPFKAQNICSNQSLQLTPVTYWLCVRGGSSSLPKSTLQDPG